MVTQLIKVTGENFNEALDSAAAIIKKGGLVGMPTETVYGLGASAYDVDAIKEIYTVKGRPQDNPIIVHICDYVMLKDVVADFDERAVRLAREFWPGPLTIIQRKSPNIPDAVTCGMPTVAVRMPSHPVAQELIRRSAVPIAAPSANLSGKPSTTTAAHVFNDLSGKIPMILDGGPCEVGIESTVISLAGEVPTILRPGIITLTEIQKILPDAVVTEYALKPVSPDQKVESPGMKHTHYAPRAKVTIVEGSLDAFCRYVSGKNVTGAFAMCFNGEQDRIDIPSVAYGDEGDGASQARRIFATLRALDALDARCIYARAPRHDDESLGVFNRLIRAAGFDVVKAQ